MQDTSTTQYTKPIPKKNAMSKCKKQNRMQSIGKYTDQFLFFIFSENTSNV